MRYSYIFAVLFCVLGIGFAFDAQATPKDRMYFLQNDGVFSEEEKDEEALYVYESCKRKQLYNDFFECGCVAGIFRMERETSKDRQGLILNKIYNNRGSPCINVPGIAGSSYEQCKADYKGSSSLIRSGVPLEKMCQCYGNHVAHHYTKKPIFTFEYIMFLKKQANVDCRLDPVMDKFSSNSE